jgi:hypothetical protein
MSEKEDVSCKYLAADHSSCRAVLEGEGRATRNQSCSRRKNLCCYLCDSRESCEISCTYLDKTQEEQEKKGPQLSPKMSPDGKEEAFTCPMCGAPYRMLIPADVIQVKCTYCGAIVLVPPHLGGAIQQCPNHPDALAVGICNDCDGNFCDRCLYLFEARDATLYLCSKCYKNRKGSGLLSYGVAGAVATVMVMVAIIGFANPGNGNVPTSVSIAFIMLGGLLFLGIMAGALSYEKKEPLSIHDTRVKKQNQETTVSNKREPLGND